ncbi:hypothetical protein Hanom_Chr09g00780901 [Helianthus anomalus]
MFVIIKAYTKLRVHIWCNQSLRVNSVELVNSFRTKVVSNKKVFEKEDIAVGLRRRERENKVCVFECFASYEDYAKSSYC